MKLNPFIITRNAHVPLDPFCLSWLRSKHFSLFKKLLAAMICDFETKDRSKSWSKSLIPLLQCKGSMDAQKSALSLFDFHTGVEMKWISFCQERLCSCRFEMLACLTACLWEERFVRTQTIILGFHMTSQKFKLRNYHFFWVSTFMRYYSTLKPLQNKFSVQKAYSFCDTGPGCIIPS